MQATNEKLSHPCFEQHASKTHGRIHLPVAPKCNIQCAYCNRKFDCANESRPGVTSKVLTPWQALMFVKRYQPVKRQISVVGIAGPGDPMANPEVVLETFELIRNEFPHLSLCLSTNGLNLTEHVETLAHLGVNHLTLTINGFDANIVKELYSWVRFKKKLYRGKDAAEILIERQFEALEKVKQYPFKIKVNSVIVKGVNDDHVLDLAKMLKDFRIDRMNLIPVIDSGKEEFFSVPRQPEADKMERIKHEVSAWVPLMEHCQKCRADAVGLIGEDDPDAAELMDEASKSLGPNAQNRPYVAVATYEGMLVNQHLGEASELQIFGYEEGKIVLKESRRCPEKGLGDDRWDSLAEALSDCRAILVSGVGPKPLKILSKSLSVIEMNGFIDEGLRNIFEGKPLDHLLPRSAFKCGDSCNGTGGGCG